MNRRPDLLTRKESAAYLGCSVGFLNNHTPKRGGPAMVKVGRRPFYLQADLDAWILACRHTAQSESPSCPDLEPATDSGVVSPSTERATPRTGGSTRTTAETATVGTPKRSFAETLRLRHGPSTTTSSPRLVGLAGGSETTSPSSPA